MSKSEESKFPEPGIEPVDEDVPGGVNPAPLFQPKNVAGENAPTNLKDAVDSVFDTTVMNVKSVLDTKHILALARGRVFAKKYKCEIMDLLCQILLEMRVSLKGRGRSDLVATLQSAIQSEISPDDEKAKSNRLFGS